MNLSEWVGLVELAKKAGKDHLEMDSKRLTSLLGAIKNEFMSATPPNATFLGLPIQVTEEETENVG